MELWSGALLSLYYSNADFSALISCFNPDMAL
ncbi:hypothetical protein T09_8355 [Trichinella sp. T9]|nr:hypothetical protein T09_8355 [Trichinella sp. T9]